MEVWPVELVEVEALSGSTTVPMLIVLFGIGTLNGGGVLEECSLLAPLDTLKTLIGVDTSRAGLCCLLLFLNNCGQARLSGPVRTGLATLPFPLAGWGACASIVHR